MISCNLVLLAYSIACQNTKYQNEVLGDYLSPPRWSDKHHRGRHLRVREWISVLEREVKRNAVFRAERLHLLAKSINSLYAHYPLGPGARHVRYALSFVWMPTCDSRGCWVDISLFLSREVVTEDES